MRDDGAVELPLALRQSQEHSRALAAAMEAWAEQRGGMGSGGAYDGYGEISFSWRAGPDSARVKLTLWADFNDAGRPVIRVEFPPGFEPRTLDEGRSAKVAPSDLGNESDVSSTSVSMMSLRETGLPLFEAVERCEACGAEGTVGRAVRFTAAGDIDELHRFCATCWPAQQTLYEGRWQQEDEDARAVAIANGHAGPWVAASTAFESATWDDASELVEMTREHGETRGRAAAHDLRPFADEMFDTRTQRVGPIPTQVATFIRRFSSRALPPDFPEG